MNKKSKIYIAISLLVTWALTFFFYKEGRLEAGTMVLMLVPGVTAFIIRLVSGGFNRKNIKGLKPKGFSAFLKAFIFSTAFVFIFVIVLAFLGAIIYKNPINNEFITNIFDVKYLIVNLISAASIGAILSLGEEYGWRGFLLPELSKGMSRVKATVIVGIVWGLFHLPVVTLMNLEGNIGNPYLVAIVQACAAFAIGFAFSYCYFISNRVYPCVIMHGFWNALNPHILGSIYKGEHGVILKNADIFMTNGEGVFGLVFGILLIPVFIILIKKLEQKDRQEAI